MAKAKQTELPVVPKQALEKMVSANTATLLNIEPNNPAVRALVLRQTGLTIPAELKTFAEVKTWLESQTPVTSAPPKSYEFVVAVAETQRGTMKFKQTAYGNGQMSLTPETVQELAEEADGIDDFRSALYDLITEWSRDHINMDNYQDIEHYDEETTESDDFNCDYNVNRLMDAVKKMLPAEEWARLNNPEF